MQIISYAELKNKDLRLMMPKSLDPTLVLKPVQKILTTVREKGDSAILEYTRSFDKVNLTSDQLRVSEEEISKAIDDPLRIFNARISTGTGLLMTSLKKRSPSFTVDSHSTVWSGCLGSHHKQVSSAILIVVRVQPSLPSYVQETKAEKSRFICSRK